MVELLNKLNNIQYEELDIDDILDKTSDTSTLGKTANSDEKNNKRRTKI